MTLNTPRRRAAGITLFLLAIGVAACAPTNESTESSDSQSSASAQDCAVDQLPLKTAGQLTIGTDSPAYPPYFENDDPSNGKGFESAVAYAVGSSPSGPSVSADASSWTSHWRGSGSSSGL